MTTNTGDNFDPDYPEGVDFEYIGVEEEIKPTTDEEMIEFEYKYASIL